MSARIYLESPANPNNVLSDLEAVAASRDTLGLKGAELQPIVIDNTFLHPLCAAPMRQRADLVAYSLPEYASGHSELVAGWHWGRQC